MSVGREPREPREPEPVCGCGHHYAKHHEDGSCAFTTVQRVLMERGNPRTVRTGYDGETHTTVYDHEVWQDQTFDCSCKRYTGPEPLPRMVS